MAKKRNYKKEYRDYQSSPAKLKYRAKLNAYNRKKGTYGNRDGLDASHKGGRIVGFENQSRNRARKKNNRVAYRIIKKGR